MAHTTNGKMTGRAAATQLGDQKEYIRSVSVPVDIQGLRARLKKHEEEAIARCIALEGEKSFYTWYTPQDNSIATRIEKIEERILLLESVSISAVVKSLISAQV